MAEILVGGVELKRIAALLAKVLVESDLGAYNVAVDKLTDDQSFRVPLDQLLAFASAVAGSQFSDALFKIFNTADDTKILEFLVSGITTATTRTLTVPDVSGLLAVAGMVDAFKFGGQATGGSFTKTFAAAASFDLDNGNSQKMTLTANITSLALTNKVNGGSYLIYLIQDGTGGWTFPTPAASFGSKTNNSADFLTGVNDVNLVNVNVDDDGITYYTIETYTP